MSRRELADQHCEVMAKYLEAAGWVGDENFLWIDPVTKYSHHTMVAIHMQLDRDMSVPRK
jgi:hypothetical protein